MNTSENSGVQSLDFKKQVIVTRNLGNLTNNFRFKEAFLNYFLISELTLSIFHKVDIRLSI